MAVVEDKVSPPTHQLPAGWVRRPLTLQLPLLPLPPHHHAMAPPCLDDLAPVLATILSTQTVAGHTVGQALMTHTIVF